MSCPCVVVYQAPRRARARSSAAPARRSPPTRLRLARRRIASRIASRLDAPRARSWSPPVVPTLRAPPWPAAAPERKEGVSTSSSASSSPSSSTSIIVVTSSFCSSSAVIAADISADSRCSVSSWRAVASACSSLPDAATRLRSARSESFSWRCSKGSIAEIT